MYRMYAIRIPGYRRAFAVWRLERVREQDGQHRLEREPGFWQLPVAGAVPTLRFVSSAASGAVIPSEVTCEAAGVVATGHVMPHRWCENTAMFHTLWELRADRPEIQFAAPLKYGIGRVFASAATLPPLDWRPENHARYPFFMRGTIRTVLIVARVPRRRASTAARALRALPFEVLMAVVFQWIAATRSDRAWDAAVLELDDVSSLAVLQ
eukprot:c20445_g1_i3.p1 GENE.c20445_g1_i3~~c20445_g1_i3.p1  ORF type:complete len:210 (-),score=15.59 c20445_g1_i3:580-1209(-)